MILNTPSQAGTYRSYAPSLLHMYLTGEGLSEKVSWRGSGGEGLPERVHRRGSDEEGLTERVQRRGSDGEGPLEKI